MSRRPESDEMRAVTGLKSHRPKVTVLPQPGEPEMPRGLDAGAKKIWRRVVPILCNLRVLTVADGEALASYCRACSQIVAAQKMIRKHGLVVEEPVLSRATGEVVGYKIRKNPAVSIQNDATKIKKSFEIEFGLTPASRVRVQGAKGRAAEGPRTVASMFPDLLKKGNQNAIV